MLHGTIGGVKHGATWPPDGVWRCRASSPDVGDVLGGAYRLVAPIGEGGTATVFEAVHVGTGKRFAVKILHPVHLRRPEMRWRFECEARLTEGLEHENITSVLDFGEAPNGAPYLVMEYLEGESLFECLQRESLLAAPRAVDLAIQACRGLAAAHMLGIVHRDVKPENLFLCRRADGSDLLKVIDFGIAKVDPKCTWLPSALATVDAERVMGTPDYMCPEQVWAPAQVDCRADVYALGAVLFEALSGERPHPASSHGAIIEHLLAKEPRRLETLRSTLPAGLSKVVHRALAFEAHDRYATVQDLAAALAPFGPEGEPTGQMRRSQADLGALPDKDRPRPCV